MCASIRYILAAAAAPTPCGFLGDPNLADYPRLANSGNQKLDEAVIGELQRIITIIPVNPEFHYIDENVPNAYALPSSDALAMGRTHGTVLLGIKLFNSLLKENDGAAAIAGICAHECAHIYQYFSEFYNRLSLVNSVVVELHADFMAGYYLGKRGDTSDERVRSFSLTLFSRTDYAYTDPTFH
jgi:Zn-dependent protease with chaperone function